MGMDNGTVENATIFIDNITAGNPEMESDNIHTDEAVSSTGEGMQELGIAEEVLKRVEVELTYSSEKLVNLDILLMHVAARESDFEALTVWNDDISADSVEKALEFDLLSGILDSEVKELDDFMDFLKREIVDARQKISCKNLRETFPEMEDNFFYSEALLKESKDQVSEMRMQSAMFQRTLSAYSGQENWNIGKDADFSGNSQFLNINAKIKMQTAEQRRHILRMLEKSLARELDLEKKLSESKQSEEELKLNLHSTEQEVFCVEEAAEVVWGRLFEAENAAKVLMEISKELMGRLQIVQFSLSSSIQREGEVSSKLQDCVEQLKAKESALQKLETRSAELDEILPAKTTSLKSKLKEAEDKYILANSETFTLREKVNSLEEQLKESEVKLQNANASAEASLENVIEDLKESISKAQSRADSAQAKCTLLTETNLELNEELGFLKSSGNNMEKVNLLEKQLMESDIQLQHAKASAEAAQEQQNLLYSAIWDMENLIEELKSKVSKAENRAESAEAKCVLLSDTNLELNGELNFLRGRMKCLESTLHQDNNMKIATVKDISIRTNVITELVMQLARERERLQKQISSLTKENKTLIEKLWKTKDTSVAMSCKGNESKKESLFSEDDLITATCTKASNDAVTESFDASFQVNKSLEEAPACVTEVKPAISVEDAVSGVSMFETLKTTGTGKSKYVFMAILILLISVLAGYVFQQKSFPF